MINIDPGLIEFDEGIERGASPFVPVDKKLRPYADVTVLHRQEGQLPPLKVSAGDKIRQEGQQFPCLHDGADLQRVADFKDRFDFQ